MYNSFGNLLRITLFGESHGTGIGVVIDGLPAGLAIDWEAVAFQMARRAPGRDALSTSRKEADLPVIQSGYFDGHTTGTPLCAVISNTNTRSGDYEPNILRPSHADYTGSVRYGGFGDYRGGGHFSGRITAPLVFAGAVCRQWLEKEGIAIGAHIAQIETVTDRRFDPCGLTGGQLDALTRMPFPVLDADAGARMQEAILAAKKEADSVGGIIECGITGLAPGLGTPFFGSVESRLSAMLFSIPAVKGVAFGEGFGFAALRGSEANDSFCLDGDAIRTRTNHNAGLNGGITNGMPVVFTVAVKPTPSIGQPQKTVDIAAGAEVEARIHGRHDPCIVQRAVPVVESAAAVVLAELVLEGRTYAG